MTNVFSCLTVILFSLICTSIQAQDSLVRYTELRFTSDFEKAAFTNFFKKNEPDQYLQLLMSVSPEATNEEYGNIKNRINGLYELMVSLDIDKKKPERKVKMVYEQVHTQMLKKYQMENRFYEIFITGNYNCVTATALYSLFFENLKMPYEIKEEPTHVYLLAYPNAGNIIVETTTPMFGFLNFDSKYKETFVTNLKNQKVIGNSETEQKSTEELFNTYYFKNEKIDLKKLIGIHYMNDALFKNDHKNTKEAYAQVQKAYFFYPSARCEYLMVNFGAVLLNQHDLKAPDRSRLIAQIARLKGQGVTTEMIKGEFTNLTLDVLYKENNKLLYKECFDIIRSGSTDLELINEISYMYYFEIGRVYYNQGNNTTAKLYFRKALTLQPNNIDLGGIFVSTIARSILNENDNKPVLDTLLFYQNTFPSLKEYNNFNSMVATATVIQFGEEYAKGNTAAGDKCRATFEDMINGDKNLRVNSSIIGHAYSSAGSYYFKKGQKSKAKEVIAKGLTLAPDSYELRTRQQMIH